MCKLTLFFVFTFLIFTGCKNQIEIDQDSSRTSNMQKRTIEQVIKDHTDEIMSIPGVQGFYQGELENGKPCITVMVDKKTEENQKKIPKELEGYPVKIEETGKIHPIN